MKVSELVEKLKEMQQDYNIIISDVYNEYPNNAFIKSITIDDDKKVVDIFISDF